MRYVIVTVVVWVNGVVFLIERQAGGCLVLSGLQK